MSNADLVEANSYKITYRNEFLGDLNIPAALRMRAACYVGTWVLWDPLGGLGGYLLVGNVPEELLAECVRHNELDRAEAA